MPTYDYECQACGHKFELFQSIKAEPIKECPVCKKNKVHRLIGAGGGLIFKGSGFYCTDYRDNKSGGSSSSSK
jgi:putative FmdB family regulatory protein